MNTFRNAAFNEMQALPRENARTANGMRSLKSTLNANVDLFGSIGAMRGKNVIPAFTKAFNENQDSAIRIAQWARDIRGGSGERKLFRDILLNLEATNPALLVESKLLENIVEIGRFDDLLIFTPNSQVENRAFGIIAQALEAGNGLAAKWMPRKGEVAVRLRNFLGLTPKQYRKTLVGLTNVVETVMCNREFGSINFSHVPSVAMSKYMTAFHKRAPEEFAAYKAALERNDGTAKINASAVYPYDVVKMAGGLSYWGHFNNKDTALANQMWKALPDYMNDQAVLPMVDVSGSMNTPAGRNTSVSCLEVAVSLGLYCSEKSKNKAFKDMFLTFSERPELVQVSGDLSQRIAQMNSAEWDMNTNLHAAFEKVLNLALSNRVPDSEMPKMLLILSDMQFDHCAHFDDSAMQMIRRKYEAAGYTMPVIVFWNLNDYGDKPVRFNERGAALISGFSPAIMKSVLAADLDKFSPESIMLQAIGSDRYAW